MTLIEEEGLRDPDLAPLATEGTTTDYFTLALCRRVYALPPANVEHVVPTQAIVPIPGAPAHVLGVVHLRGRIVTVVDLAALLAIAGPASEGDPRLVIVTVRAYVFAFQVDATLGLWPVVGELAAVTTDGPLVVGRVSGATGAIATVLDLEAMIDRILGTERAA
jgi:chemotaxis signal transduction protein